MDQKLESNRASALSAPYLLFGLFPIPFFTVAPTKCLVLAEIRQHWVEFFYVCFGMVFLVLTDRKNIYTEIKMAILTGITILLWFSTYFTMSPAIDLMQSTTGLGWTYVNQLDNKLYWFYVAYIVFGCYLCIEILIDWLKEYIKHFRRLLWFFWAWMVY